MLLVPSFFSTRDEEGRRGLRTRARRAVAYEVEELRIRHHRGIAHTVVGSAGAHMVEVADLEKDAAERAVIGNEGDDSIRLKGPG